jgi:hypothetical protein
MAKPVEGVALEAHGAAESLRAPVPMPKLPDTSAAAILKRAKMSEAKKAEAAKEPAPPPPVKVRIAKSR